MATIIQNVITLAQKEAVTLPVEIRSSDGKVYIPMDSDTVIFTVKESTASKKAIISKAVTDGMVTLTTADTNIAAGYYVYDIELVGIDGYTDTIVEPTFFVVTESSILTRSIDITRYLPAVTDKCLDIIELCKSDNVELTELWNNLCNVLYNQFIVSMTDPGLERWETIFGVEPDVSDTWADRRFRILTLLRGTRPFTDEKMEELLDSICGTGGYIIERNYDKYALTIKLNLGVKKQLAQAKATLETIVPMNLGLTVTLNYNRHKDLKRKFTHGEMRAYSHKSLREDPL